MRHFIKLLSLAIILTNCGGSYQGFVTEKLSPPYVLHCASCDQDTLGEAASRWSDAASKELFIFSDSPEGADIIVTNDPDKIADIPATHHETGEDITLHSSVFAHVSLPCEVNIPDKFSSVRVYAHEIGHCILGKEHHPDKCHVMHGGTAGPPDCWYIPNDISF